MKKSHSLIAATIWLGLLFGCEKEVLVKEEVLIEPQLIVSADTLFFDGIVSSKLYLSTTPASTSDFRITSKPDWAAVYPEFGIIDSDIKELTITTYFNELAPGDYEGDVTILSTSGTATVTLKGFVESNLSFLFPDSLFFNMFSGEQNLTISNQGNVNVNYSLSSSEDYLVFGSASGEVGVDVETDIRINVKREGLATGTYFSEIYLEVDDHRDTIKVKVENFKERKQILTSDVIDVEYSKAKDLLAYVTTNSSLYVYNTVSKSTERLELSFLPTCLSLSLDGTKVVVGHDGRLTYVDLEVMKVINTYDVSCQAVDIVLGNNDWAYVFPKHDQWETIRCINLKTALETLNSGQSISAGTKAKLHPSGKFIYGADNGSSPSDMEKYDIQNGTAAYLYDSPYHGDYNVSGDLWFSEDGARVFSRGRTVFKTSEIKELDMRYNGSIDLGSSMYYGLPKIMSLDHSGAKENLYIISSVDDDWSGSNKPYILVHNANNLTVKYQIDLEEYLVMNYSGDGQFYPAEPHFVFSNSTGEEIFVFTKAIGSGLVNEWAIQNFSIE